MTINDMITQRDDKYFHFIFVVCLFINQIISPPTTTIQGVIWKNNITHDMIFCNKAILLSILAHKRG